LDVSDLLLLQFQLHCLFLVICKKALCRKKKKKMLPTEILLNIFQRLNDVKDLCHCEIVCKQWHEVASADVIWSRKCWQDFDLDDLFLSPEDICSSNIRVSRLLSIHFIF
jgi:hypothetical protein